MRSAAIALSIVATMATAGAVIAEEEDAGVPSSPAIATRPTGSVPDRPADLAAVPGVAIVPGVSEVLASPASEQPFPGDVDPFEMHDVDGVLLAQGTAGEPPSQPAVDPSKTDVDETALRYFARQGDTKRLQAEIARLKALYPNWTPPADPAAIPPQTDARLDAMWKLYAQGQYAQLRKAIADRATSEPGWTAPTDLIKLLGVAEARETLINASSLKQYQTVIRIGSQTPSLLTCSDVDVLWRVAEAFASTDRLQRAKDAYLYILKTCSDPRERAATLQKAIPLLPRDMIEDLLATERPGEDGKGEFAVARDDILRRRFSAAGNDPKTTVSATDVAAMTALAERDKLAADDKLLGWYFLRHEQPDKAESWFRKAYETDKEAQAAQGLALALIASRRAKEAEGVLYPFNEASDEARKTYLAAVATMLSAEPPVELSTEVLQRVVPVVVKARDAASAEQLGWYARALDQHETAGKWFRTALDWNADDEPSAYGLALTFQELGQAKDLAQLQRAWAGRSERIEKVGRSGRPDGRRSQAEGSVTRVAERQPTEGGRMPAAVAPVRTGGGSVASRVARLPQRRGCSGTASATGLEGEAALAHGWCLMDLDRPAEAARSFGIALLTSNVDVRSDAAWGQSLAYLRLGQTAKASVAAAKEAQSPNRQRDLQIALLAQRASAFFEAQRFSETLLTLDARSRLTAETLDLMSLRGYAYLGLRRYEDARRIFRSIAATGDHSGLRGLADVDAASR